MSELYFITGNSNKFAQAQKVIPKLKQRDIDLIEMQEIDTKEIIKEKLNEASKVIEGEFFCEDTSLEIEGLNGLPGPLIKWFLKTVEAEGIAKMAIDSGNTKAIARSTIGYENKGKIMFFEATVNGKIVMPRGRKGFGWDPIFQAEGMKETFGELSLDERDKVTMRTKALIKLKDYLESEKDGE